MDKLIEQNIKVDMVLTDPPYGTTQCKWDSIIPFETMWERINKIIKNNGCIALFGSEPFSSKLRCSNFKMYKYDWIWRKNKCVGFLNAKNAPLKNFENISIFSDGNVANVKNNKMPYYPQGLIRVNKKRNNIERNDETIVGNRPSRKGEYIQEYKGYPTVILEFSVEKGKQIHPTQKPINLLEYLIKTYTNENETVLDFTMGSGSTGVACINTNRKFIGIEKEEKYFDISVDRIKQAEIDNKNLKKEEI